MSATTTDKVVSLVSSNRFGTISRKQYDFEFEFEFDVIDIDIDAGPDRWGDDDDNDDAGADADSDSGVHADVDADVASDAADEDDEDDGSATFATESTISTQKIFNKLWANDATSRAAGNSSRLWLCLQMVATTYTRLYILIMLYLETGTIVYQVYY